MFSRWFKRVYNRVPKAEEKPYAETRCPLCGKAFQPNAATPCSSCALAKKCGSVRCPHCQYEFAV